MFLPNWSAKVEYLYYDLGSTNASVPLGGGSPPAAPFLLALLTTASYNGQIVRVGLNYHFNWESARSGRREILTLGDASSPRLGKFFGLRR